MLKDFGKINKVQNKDQEETTFEERRGMNCRMASVVIRTPPVKVRYA